MSEYSKPFFLPSSLSNCEGRKIPGRRWQKKSRTGKIGSWSASSSAPFRHLDCRTVGGSSLRTDCTVALRKALSSYTVINDDCGNCLKRTTYFPTRNVFFPLGAMYCIHSSFTLSDDVFCLCAYPAFTACTNVRSTISKVGNCQKWFGGFLCAASKLTGFYQQAQHSKNTSHPLEEPYQFSRKGGKCRQLSIHPCSYTGTTDAFRKSRMGVPLSPTLNNANRTQAVAPSNQCRCTIHMDDENELKFLFIECPVRYKLVLQNK